MQPIALPANLPDTFYRGAGRIARFRRLPSPPGVVSPSGVASPSGASRPEDWVASTTRRFGTDSDAGLTTLPDGRLLRDAIAAQPERWLGPAHVDRYGADPTILVKLLDAGERLPVHAHPDRRFAAAHLASPYGKTEAWVILEAAPDAVVYLGFTRTVEPDELSGWVAAQHVEAMLAATNRVPVRAGDSVLVPAGLPHAIGSGMLLVEVQEATDFSVLLESERFGLDPSGAFVGLPRELALSCVDRAGWDPARLAGLRRDRDEIRPGAHRLLPADADEFFAAERLRPDPVAVLDAEFSILVVSAGRGVLDPENGTASTVAAGDTIVVPYASGPARLTGDVEAIRLRPAPSAQ
jgi:mannose-6-phosphate isomerase